MPDNVEQASEFARYKRAAKTPAKPTLDGKKWAGRMRAADNYFRRNVSMWNWEENRELLAGFEKVLKTWGSIVAVGYAIQQNFVADLWYQSPDPFVQDKAGNRDKGRMMSDVFRSVHNEIGTERNMRAALEDTVWAGFGAVQQWFDENGDYFFRPLVDDETGEELVEEDGAIPMDLDGEPLVQRDETGAPVTDYVQTAARIMQRRLSPWDLRVDPEGSEWTLDDHRFIAIKFWMSLSAIQAEPRFSGAGKTRLRGYVTNNIDRFRMGGYETYADIEGYEEGDLDWIRIPIWEIWDRINYEVVYLPAISANGDARGGNLTAEFLLNEPKKTPWPEEFKIANRFPVEFIGFNRQPEDEKKSVGFWPIPVMSLIKHHVKSIHRLESLFLEANTHVINKYFMPEGFFDDVQTKKLQSDVNREVITYDPNALSKLPGVQASLTTDFDIRRLIQLAPQGEIKEMRHIEGIQHEMNMIAQIIGQTTADRGGLPSASSATEALGLQQRLKQRIDNLRSRVGANYNRLTEMIWMMLRTRQQLPVRYQRTTSFNEKIWDEVSSDKFAELDLHFDHVTAPSEPRTREQEIALRRQAAEIALPVLQSSGDTMRSLALIRSLIEPLNVRSLESIFDDEITEIAKQLAEIEMGLMDGNLSPTKVAGQKQELIAKLLQLLLPPAAMQDVAMKSAGGGAGAAADADKGTGAVMGAMSEGQNAYASAKAGPMAGNGSAMGQAAAGMTGGM